MLDLFAIFSKGGIVLWCFQSTSSLFTPSVNALIRSAILQERSGNKTFEHEALMLQYKLDNEFELVFVVAYQKILQLSYVDKFLDDIHLEFRDKYKNDLKQGIIFQEFEFKQEFSLVLQEAEEWSQLQSKAPKQMRTFKESQKSKKSVASMVEKAGAGFSAPASEAAAKKEAKKAGKEKKKGGAGVVNGGGVNGDQEKMEAAAAKIDALPSNKINGELDEDMIMQNRQRLASRMAQPKKKKDIQKSPKPTSQPSSKEGKKPRIWDLGGNSRDLATLERTRDKPEDASNGRDEIIPDSSMVGKMKGGIHDLEIEDNDGDDDYEEDEDYEEEEEEEEELKLTKGKGKGVQFKDSPPQNKGRQSGTGGVFSLFRGLVGSKSVTQESMQPVLEKLKDHLITKNVAADISLKLCESVATQIEGKVLGTFESVSSTVRATLTEALVQILSPKRRLDILRDVVEAKNTSRPYVMSFCGVNGVGKSTNLAKICFWLIENGHRVLIAACDTFRAGAVEQLRTHVRHLNALHPPEKHAGRQMVQLYEKGYGKDAAGIAMEAIHFARDAKVDVVLIDTAGRMQDNEPLMRALAKLIKVNEPDMVLFVGEALVGNEAVDQLVKFNRALADNSDTSNPHLIDGIVLTKFDTIDDKVGAAISMTYITGQPIVFVGTGQTYTDLRSLNAKAVVHALMK